MADDISTRAPARPDMREIGVTGTKLFAGQVAEELVPALQGLQAYATYTLMRNDATCAAVLKSIELPIRASRWYVAPASDDPAHVEHADFVHDMLWSFGSQSFDDAMRLALGDLIFGFNLMEIVYSYIQEGPWKGKVGWEKFAWRSQATKFRWNMAEIDGRQELVSVTQLAPPYYQAVDVPRNKLIIHVNDQEGDNFDGRSLLRPAYKNWYYRSALYKIQSIGLERSYMGIPIAKLPDAYSDEMRNLAQQITTNFRTDEAAGAVIPADLILDIWRNELGSGREMQEAIQHHDIRICMSALAQFLELGTGKLGSYALSSDQSELFLMAINAKANYAAEQFNLDPGIPALLRFNFPEVARSATPRLSHGDIGRRSLEMLGRTLMALGRWGFITPDDATEDTFREMLDLPERDVNQSNRYLEALAARTFPAVQDPARKSFGSRSPQMRLGMGSIPATGEGAPAGSSAAMAEHHARMRRAMFSRPWRRPQGRLTETDRAAIQCTEALVEALQDVRSDLGGRPERPSITLAKRRRPYELMPPPKTAKRTPPTTRVVPHHRIVAQAHIPEIQDVFSRLGRS